MIICETDVDLIKFPPPHIKENPTDILLGKFSHYYYIINIPSTCNTITKLLPVCLVQMKHLKIVSSTQTEYVICMAIIATGNPLFKIDVLRKALYFK